MNSYGELINILPDEGKKLIRTRESIIKKIINAELSITFNETCIRENLLPTYTLNIYIYIYIYLLYICVVCLSVCLCLINYASEGHNSYMGHTYEG